MKYKIHILNTIFVGTEIINQLKKEIKIEGIIGLNNNFHNTDVISGFDDMKLYCETNNIDFIGVDSYNLENDTDKNKLLNLSIDVLLVLGWQRLVPKWVLEHVKIISIGAHGSPWGKEKGRGRSPMNWALICNQDKFIIDIFRLDSGIDSGDIIDEQKFAINEYDDINSVYFKASWCIAKMIIKNIKNDNIFNFKLKNNSEEVITYLPRRNPEDGEIDWNRSNGEVYNFIRALTRPYPGAFSYYDNKKVYIWRAIPFEDMEGFEIYKPGEVIKYFITHDEFIIKCGIGAILVKEYESDILFDTCLENKILSSTNFRKQMQEIIERHYSKYKNNLCNEELYKIT